MISFLRGIRLAAYDVPTAKNTGMNYCATNRFCFLYGSHEPFMEATLSSLYLDHDAYMSPVREVVQRNLIAGYILPYAAEKTLEAAKSSKISR